MWLSNSQRLPSVSIQVCPAIGLLGGHSGWPSSNGGAQSYWITRSAYGTPSWRSGVVSSSHTSAGPSSHNCHTRPSGAVQMSPTAALFGGHGPSCGPGCGSPQSSVQPGRSFMSVTGAGDGTSVTFFHQFLAGSNCHSSPLMSRYGVQPPPMSNCGHTGSTCRWRPSSQLSRQPGRSTTLSMGSASGSVRLIQAPIVWS